MGEKESLKSARTTADGDELLGCTVPVFIVSELRDLVDEMRETLQAEKRERRRSEQLLAKLIELSIESEDENRRRSALQKMQLECSRREAEYSLPSYFWRRDKESSAIQMLQWRAQYLVYDARAGMRDVWAFLQEFNREYSGDPVDDDALKAIVEKVLIAPGEASHG